MTGFGRRKIASSIDTLVGRVVVGGLLMFSAFYSTHGEPHEITLEEATRENQIYAVKQYPSLAKAGSPLHQKFMEIYKQANASHSEELKSSYWPLGLARDAVLALAEENGHASLRVLCTRAIAERLDRPLAGRGAPPNGPQRLNSEPRRLFCLFPRTTK
jgi:hypothetical protein